MKLSAAEVTDSARSDVEGRDRSCGGADVTTNVKCNDSKEIPTADVRGLGHGIRAVTLPTEPSWSWMGSPASNVLIALNAMS